MDIACAMDKLEEGKVESQELKVEEASDDLTEDQPTVVDRKVRLARQTEVENLKKDLVDVRNGISLLKKEVERLKTINTDVSDEAYLVLKEVHRLRKVVEGARYRSSVLQEKEKDLMELRELLYTTVGHMVNQNAVLKAENEDLRKDDDRLRDIIGNKSDTGNKGLTQNTDLLPMSRLENENSGERQKDLSPHAGESLPKMHLVFKSLRGFITHGSKSKSKGESRGNGVKSKVEADDGLATGSSDMDVTNMELQENNLLPKTQHSLQENDMKLKIKVFEENTREREKGLPAPAEVCAGQVLKKNSSVLNEIGGFCTHGLKKIPISTQESQSKVIKQEDSDDEYEPQPGCSNMKIDGWATERTYRASEACHGNIGYKKHEESEEEFSTTSARTSDKSNGNVVTDGVENDSKNPQNEGESDRKDIENTQGESDDESSTTGDDHAPPDTKDEPQNDSENKGQSQIVALDWEWWESNDLCVADASRANDESDAGSIDNIIDWEWWGLDGEFRGLRRFLEGESLNEVYKKQGKTSQPGSSDVIG
ncbi:uncharacterized protein LOC117938707 [Etheostoma cragini]|uniref:uncharacterized protein LOC117938707 n=1 Tax=Etheostoma cragini TaxID=417921 RepID=UPI00155EC218|nr:uncharacterized protein LOC117938707 [Etheostoma cragini]